MSWKPVDPKLVEPNSWEYPLLAEVARSAGGGARVSPQSEVSTEPDLRPRRFGGVDDDTDDGRFLEDVADIGEEVAFGFDSRRRTDRERAQVWSLPCYNSPCLAVSHCLAESETRTTLSPSVCGRHAPPQAALELLQQEDPDAARDYQDAVRDAEQALGLEQGERDGKTGLYLLTFDEQLT